MGQPTGRQSSPAARIRATQRSTRARDFSILDIPSAVTAACAAVSGLEEPRVRLANLKLLEAMGVPVIEVADETAFESQKLLMQQQHS